MRATACVYCGASLHRFQPIVKRKPWGDSDERRVRVCQTCGWWKVTKIDHLEEGSLYRGFRSAAAGSLKTLNLANSKTTVDEVRAYLLAKYQARHEVNPYLFEKTVASVYGDLGYGVLVTSRSGDDGIDVLLHGPADEVVGVQIKRYRHAIEVAQIRELLGALVVNGLTRGVFVTTSKFQRGAARTADMAEAQGYSVELIDGDAFYKALQLAQRNQFNFNDAESLVAMAKYTPMSDTGTVHTGIAPIYNPGLLKGLPGPGGPQDEWP